MKKHTCFLLFISIAFSGFGQKEKEPYLVKVFNNEKINQARISTTGGNIEVEGVEGISPRIEVYITENNGRSGSLSNEEIQKRLDADYDLTIVTANGNLTAEAKNKHRINNWRKALNISFKAFINKNTFTDLSTSGGNIRLLNLSGKQKFSTSGGNLDIDHLNGTGLGKTSGGNIRLRNSSDDIDLTTSGGNVDAENCSGKLRLSTSGGSVVCKKLKGDIRATTSGGNIEGDNIEGELMAHTSGGNVELQNLACSLEASTSGGEINIEMASVGKYVKIHNSGGNINLQIPANTAADLDLSGSKVTTSSLKNFNGRIEENEIRGKWNGGGVPVNVNSSSGRLHLTIK